METKTQTCGLVVATTFSPAMLGDGVCATVAEISLENARGIAQQREFQSAVGHEVTAPVLSALLETPVSYNRLNLKLSAGGAVLCVIPNFRASEAREFTKEEVEAAGYRCFYVECEESLG